MSTSSGPYVVIRTPAGESLNCDVYINRTFTDTSGPLISAGNAKSVYTSRSYFLYSTVSGVASYQLKVGFTLDWGHVGYLTIYRTASSFVLHWKEKIISYLKDSPYYIVTIISRIRPVACCDTKRCNSCCATPRTLAVSIKYRCKRCARERWWCVCLSVDYIVYRSVTCTSRNMELAPLFCHSTTKVIEPATGTQWLNSVPEPRA